MVSIDGKEHSDSLIRVRNLNKIYRRGGETIEVLQGLPAVHSSPCLLQDVPVHVRGENVKGEGDPVFSFGA